MARVQAMVWEKYLRYLDIDDDVDKREQFVPVREAIMQYIYHDEPENKFTLGIFSEILEDNFENKDDFSLPGMIHAFEALEKYALNLVFAPWRQEYRTIKLFGGFYKHKVARHMRGAEKILHLMNYKFVDRDTLVLDGNIDDEILTKIAFNCLIASVQCEAIQENFTALRNVGIPCTPQAAFKLQSSFPSKSKMNHMLTSRKDNVDGTSATSNGHLNGIKSRSEVKVEQLVDVSRPSDYSEKIGPEALYETVRKREKPHTSAVQSGNKSVPYRNINKNVPKDKPDKMSELFKPGTLEHHIQASESTIREQPKIVAEQPATRAATWDFVDRTLYNNPKYDRDELLQQELALRRPQSTQTELNQMDPKYCSAYFPYPMIHPLAAFQIPGYPPLYAPTELLARGIPIPPGYPFMHPPTALEATWGMRNLRVNEENLMSQSPERGNGSYGEVGNRRSFYDNVEHERTPDMSAATTNNRHRTSNHPFPSKTRDSFESYPSPPSPFGGDDEMLIEIDGPTPHQLNTDGKITRDGSKGNKKDKEKDKISSTNLDKRGSSSSPRSSVDDRSGSNSDSSNQWQCKYCTYFNDQQENICTMCGRSKNKGAEATPMKTGGKVCSHCTLVNDSKAKQCAACDQRLEGCSTYV